MAPRQEGPDRAVLTRLFEENQLTEDSLLFREVERGALLPGPGPGRYRLAPNSRPSESVLDVYGPGYVVQAESLGPGLAFADSRAQNWQETMELRALRSGAGSSRGSPADRLLVEARLGDLLKQGGLMYPVESVTVERAWYFTLPSGPVEVKAVGPA